MIYLDTHVIVWLYIGDMIKFSDDATSAINGHPAVISPIVSLELTYLHEIGRIKTEPDVMIEYVSEHIGLKICDLPFEQVITSATKQVWTRDPFDRIIVGHAAVQGRGLVTKDEVIHRNYRQTIW